MYTRLDELDPMPYTEELPSLMSSWGRVDIHTVVAKFLSDNKLDGEYLEFGVGRGRSAVSAIRAYKRASVCKKFHLFDSFCGLPKLEGVDENSSQFKEGDYAYSLDEVKQFIKDHHITIDESVQFMEGWINETFGKWSQRNKDSLASVVHVDVDLHASCATILKDLYPLLQDGAVILFDDWNCFKASSKQGERKAVSDWLKTNENLKLHRLCSYGWHGRAFIVEL